MARYPFPWDLLLRLAVDLPSGEHSLISDCRAMRNRIHPPPVVTGRDCIPDHGPVVIAANHYQRRGLWIGWTGAIIATEVAYRRGEDPPIHWLVTGGLRLFQWRDAGPELPGTRRIFNAVARTYGMAALPLIDVRRRSQVMRAWIRWAEQGDALGIFPEGVTGSSAGLGPASPGFPALCRLLGNREIPIVPCGAWEENEALCVAFGPPANPPDLLLPNAADRVMAGVAGLLPPRLRGPYREHVIGEMG